MFESKNYAEQAGIVGSGRSLYVASLFLLNIGLARSMGTEGFGSFQQVFMFSALFMILTLGIPETMYYFLPRLSDEERPRFFGQTLMTLLAAGGCVALILWFGAPFFAEIQHNYTVESHFKIFGIYGAFLIASSFSDPVFIMYRRVRYLFTLSVLHGLFFVALTLWYIFMKSSPDTLFKAMAVFGLCKYLLALTLLFRIRSKTGVMHFFRGKSTFLLQMSFFLPIALSNTVDIMSRWLDKFVISVFFGAGSLGVFYVGALEIPFIGIVVSSVFNVISPVLNSLHHKNDIEGFVKLVKQTFQFTSKIIWPVFVYLFVFADHIIPLIFKEDFQGAVTPFRIYLLLMPLRIASYGTIMLALGRPRIVFLSAFAALAVNFVLNIVLVIHIGFIGPAIATVISSYFHVFVLLYVIVRKLNIRVSELIPFNFFLAAGVTSGLAVMIAYAITWKFTSDLSTIIFSFTIFMTAYFFLGTYAGFLRLSDFTGMAGGRYFGKKDHGRKS